MLTSTYIWPLAIVSVRNVNLSHIARMCSKTTICKKTNTLVFGTLSSYWNLTFKCWKIRDIFLLFWKIYCGRKSVIINILAIFSWKQAYPSVRLSLMLSARPSGARLNIKLSSYQEMNILQFCSWNKAEESMLLQSRVRPLLSHYFLHLKAVVKIIMVIISSHGQT